MVGGLDQQLLQVVQNSHEVAAGHWLAVLRVVPLVLRQADGHHVLLVLSLVLTTVGNCHVAALKW